MGGGNLLIYNYLCRKITIININQSESENFMKKLKTMLLMASLAVGFMMSAAEDSLYMIFSHSDGTVTQVEIPLPWERPYPTMKFTKTSIEITIPSQTPGEAPAIHSIGVEDVVNTTFSETTSIKSSIAGNDAVFTSLGGNCIRITVPEEISADGIYVYEITGKLLPCDAAVNGNSATVSLDKLPAGVYVIVYQNNSIKVTKK